MKKLNRRALSVMMISLFIILGLFTYIERFLRDGENWASYFSRLNSLSEGYVTDRNGNEDRNTRIANYHVTGDFWNRTGSGILTNFARQLHGYSPVTGMTQTKRISLKLNVDSVLDNKAYAALAGRKGAVGIVNYRTGELICMVSSPAVDPVESDPVAPEGVYINRLLSASFTPGSIFKLITAAAAIECVPTIWQRSFFCLGEEEISGVLFHCSRGPGQFQQHCLRSDCHLSRPEGNGQSCPCLWFSGPPQPGRHPHCGRILSSGLCR